MLYVNESLSAVYIGGKLVPAGQAREVSAPQHPIDRGNATPPEDPGNDGEPHDAAIGAAMPPEDPGGDGGAPALPAVPGELAPGDQGGKRRA